MPSWILTMVVNYVLRAIARWSDTLDWNKVKADVAARLKPLLPDWIETVVLDAANAAIDVCAYVLADAADLKKIADLLQAGDFAGAFAALVALFEEAMKKPAAPAHVAAVCDAVREMQKAA